MVSSLILQMEDFLLPSLSDIRALYKYIYLLYIYISCNITFSLIFSQIKAFLSKNNKLLMLRSHQMPFLSTASAGRSSRKCVHKVVAPDACGRSYCEGLGLIASWQHLLFVSLTLCGRDQVYLEEFY